MNRIKLLLVFVAFCSPAFAGRYNKILSVGDEAPAWTDLPGTDDAKHSLEDFADKEMLVVVITCNSCPYAMDAEPRLIELQKKYADRGLLVVAISASKEPEDELEEMKRRAEEREYPFPYLHDQSQQIARDYGAKYTPEFYVLNKQRRIVYMGAWTESFFGKSGKKQYVELAIEALLAGEKPEVEETAPIGCAIQYERLRRKRRARTEN